MVESAKDHAGKAKTWIKSGCSGWKHAQAGAEQDQMKSYHKAHPGHGRVRHFIKQALHFFVLPAIFGVIGGLLACALGMMVGQALAYLLNRRSSRERFPRNVEAAMEADEKDALMEGGEMPPQYEDVDVVMIEDK